MSWFVFLLIIGFIVCEDCKIFDSLLNDTEVAIDVTKLLLSPFIFASCSLDRPRCSFDVDTPMGDWTADKIETDKTQEKYFPWSDPRSFSFYEAFRKYNWGNWANRFAHAIPFMISRAEKRDLWYKDLLVYCKNHKPPALIPYCPRHPETEKNILKSGEQAQATWNYYIKEFSDQVLAPMDQINAFLNGANITKLSNLPYHLRNQYNHENWRYVGRIVKRVYWKQKMEKKFVVDLMSLQNGIKGLNRIQAEAECVYEIHERLRFQKPQFLDYVNRFFFAIMKAVCKADKTSIHREYDFICKSIFLDLDINELTTNLYESFIELREFASKIDVDSLADNINILYNMGPEAPWLLELGKWPEMAKFVENFFGKTLGSEDFWLRIDELYQNSINLWEDISSTGQKELALILQYDITSFLEEFLNGLENLPEKREFFSEYVRQFPSYFDQRQTFSRMNEKVCWFLKELHLMEFQTMKRVYGGNNIFKKLTNIFFSNWPTEEVYPKSFDEFFQKLHAQVLSVINNIVGSCQN